MSDACSVVPPQVREANRQAWQTCELDIVGLERFELIIPLNEHEKAGIRPSTWAPTVHALAERECERWCKAHADRIVRAVTYGTTLRDGTLACVVVLHHQGKEK